MVKFEGNYNEILTIRILGNESGEGCSKPASAFNHEASDRLLS